MVEKIKDLFNLKNVLNQELVEYIIIYLRKSRKDAEFGKDEPIEKTLERHEKILQDWAINVFGCKIPEKNIFREVVSGDTIADRPEMQKVLELVEKDEIKAVLCIEIERLARGNTIDQGTIAQKFQITNTKILTPNKIFDLDDEYDMGYFEDGLHQSRKYLQYVKKILSRGREQSVNEGNYVASTPLFGYDKLKCEKEKGFTLIKNADAEIVRKIFDLYLYDDLGTQEIAKKLNSLGYKSPSGNLWSDSMVRNRIDRAEIYAGYVIWNKRKTTKKYINGEIYSTRPINQEYKKCIGKHKEKNAIITDEELKKVELKRKKLSVKTIPSEYQLQNPLAGVVKCAFCGRNMSRRPYTMSYVKSGIVHKDTLLCRTMNCKNVSSDLDVVEKRILDYLENKLKDYKYKLKTYNTTNQKQSDKFLEEKKQISKKIESINNQKQKCCEFLETGTYDEETFKIRIKSLNEELKSAENNLADLDKKIKNEQNNQYIKSIPIIENCLKLYKNATVEEKNKLLLSIIDSVYYRKTNKGGRWNTEARYDFELEINLKI